jgi:signal transduction histidine kinase
MTLSPLEDSAWQPPVPSLQLQDMAHFYQGSKPDRREAGSIGLGLAAAKRLAQAHGGDIRVLPTASADSR